MDGLRCCREVDSSPDPTVSRRDRGTVGRVIRYYTAAEVRDILRVPIAEVYRLANEDAWRKVRDRRRPALYNGDDVDATIQRVLTRRDGPA